MTENRRLIWLIGVLVLVAAARVVLWWSESSQPDVVTAEDSALAMASPPAMPTPAQSGSAKSAAGLSPNPVKPSGTVAIALLRDPWSESAPNVFAVNPKSVIHRPAPAPPAPVPKQPFVRPEPVIYKPMLKTRVSARPAVARQVPVKIPFEPLGFVEEEGELRVFVLSQGRVVAASVGDIIEKQWLLVHADRNLARFKHGSSKNSHVFRYASN